MLFMVLLTEFESAELKVKVFLPLRGFEELRAVHLPQTTTPYYATLSALKI